MATVRGFCLNLPEQRQRRERFVAHLHQLALPGLYSLFEASRGHPDAAARRGLSPGEDGIWRSVLALLEHACSSGDLDGYDGLHILEDDAVLSPEFCCWLADVDLADLPVDIVLTDMYAGPTVFPQRQAFFEEAFADNRLRWLAGSEYTGCLASWLIPVDRVPAVAALLRQIYQQQQQMIPIDNLLRRLFVDGQLQGAVSVPFLTSIDLESQAVSAIQDQSDRAVAATARVADLLRRRLSVLRDGRELEQLLPLLAELRTPAQLSAQLGALVEAVQQDRGFRYRFDARLLDQPGNPQASWDQTASARARSASGL